MRLKINDGLQQHHLMRIILQQYIEFTIGAIEIKKDGVRLTKEFKDLSNIFQKDLFDNHKKNKPFIKKLMKQFQAKDLQ